MKQLLLAITVLLCLQSRAQITFVDANTSWKELSKEAKAQDKLIFIHFENSDCVQCNEVATMGFSKPELKDMFDDNFICIRCNVATPNGRSLAQQFGIMSSLLSLYVDPNGNILHVNNGSTSDWETYEQGAKVAWSRKGKKQLADYDKEYKSGKRDAVFLKEYMAKKREASMAIDGLLDEYVTGLPEDSLRRFQTVKEIYEFAPALNSQAYQRIKSQAPQALTDSIFKSSTPENRKLVNEGIMENSFVQAIRKRDEDYAVKIAEFARDSDLSDRRQSEMAYDKALIRYYYGIRDTRKYIAQVSKLVETHYMPLTVDSLNAIDDAAFDVQRRALMNRKKQPKRDETGVTAMSIAFMPPSQFIHKELNEHAYHIFELTRDKEALAKALTWSQKAMELAERKGTRAVQTPYQLGDPNYLDTYAHILYKLGRKDEAIEWQTKAVEAQKITGQAYQAFEIPLIKMKAGTL
ncbi:hypothetical protein GCM10010967_16460 [Dyadobacter beijingensis]|uniref:Thioredoxin-related protein n=1 Tax=Dyadobacter beijingensis TaxID=365489 RepID=A0ABQ2HMD0_9BACT|nr:thioredoxin family protein [Dyadobacter beijingensis]GGM85197.1 hypothetical protein GCM10010967_16460 [Dyadobacter beijingensis]